MNVADSHVFHGAGWQNPYRVAAYGKGIYLYDTEGKCYLDAIAGTHVVSIGHGVEEVADAIAAQARKLSFVNKGQFTTQVQEELANAQSRVKAGSGSPFDQLRAEVALAKRLYRKNPEDGKTAVAPNDCDGARRRRLRQ